MTRWCSLYLPCAAEDVAETLKQTLPTLGYQFYDPFGLIPGKAYPQAVRLFAQPTRGGWTRLLGEPNPALLPALSRLASVLWVELDGADARIDTYANGAASPPETAFPTYANCLHSARRKREPVANDSLGGVSLNALPDDIQELAQKVDLKQAGSMFSRLSGNLAAKSGDAAAHSVGHPAARDLLRQPEWNSAGGAQIAAVLACLNIPGWRDPDFVTLRDAYTLHVRRRRTPKAALYPGDAEALAAVPDALAYTPIYAGKL